MTKAIVKMIRVHRLKNEAHCELEGKPEDHDSIRMMSMFCDRLQPLFVLLRKSKLATVPTVEYKYKFK